MTDLIPIAWMESPHGALRANMLYQWTAPQSVQWSLPLYGQHHLDAAVAAERERCARLCESAPERYDITGGAAEVARALAKEIRSDA